MAGSKLVSTMFACCWLAMLAPSLFATKMALAAPLFLLLLLDIVRQALR